MNNFSLACENKTVISNAWKEHSITDIALLPLTQKVFAQCSVGVLDDRHGFFPDDTFDEYISNVIQSPIPTIALSYNLHGLSSPQKAKLLFTRWTRAAQHLKRHNKTVISPLIEETAPIWLSEPSLYKLFDYNGLRVCFEGSKTGFARIASALQSVLDVAVKPTFVMQFSVASSTMWGMPSPEIASRHLCEWHTVLTSLTHRNIRWFFTGTGQDRFRPGEMPLDRQDQEELLPTAFQWDWRHCLGTETFDGIIKQPLVAAVSQWL